MNNQQLMAVKKIHEALRNIMTQPHSQMFFMRAMPDSDLRLEDVLLMDALRFMVYVADADGFISQREVNIINYITGKYLSIEGLNELVERNRAYYIELMPKVPLTVVVLCMIENEFYENGESLDGSMLGMAIEYFKILGALIADADEYVSYFEKERIGAFIGLLHEYAEEHTLSPFYGLDFD